MVFTLLTKNKRVFKKMITKSLTNFEVIKLILGKLPEKYRNPKIIPLTTIHIALEWNFERKFYIHFSLNTLHLVKINYLKNDVVELISAHDKDDDENVSVVVTDTTTEKTTIKGFFTISNESIEFLIKTFEEYDALRWVLEE